MAALNQAYKKSSFSPAFFFLSKPRREALAVYYEFCRLADDIADEPQKEDPLQVLAFWQQEVERIFQHSAQTDLGKQLTKVVQDFGLTPDRFSLLLEGMQADIQGKTYPTLKDLEWYLHRVAVVVGLATLDILGVKGPTAQELAQNLGRAVQLTNIIRDVPADARLGRVYLPEEGLSRYGLCREDILSGRKRENQARLLCELAQVASEYYAQSFRLMRSLPRGQRLPCQMIGCVYAQNLAKIERVDFRFTHPVKLSKWEKVKYCIYAFCKTPIF